MYRSHQRQRQRREPRRSSREGGQSDARQSDGRARVERATLRAVSHLQDEIAVDRTAEAGDLDLEVGNAVAVGVALQQAAGEAKLAGGAR